MKLPEILQGVPPWALFVTVPVGAFIVATAVALGVGGGGGGDDPPVEVPQRLSVQNLDVAATATPAPTETPPPNREDCDEIRGTDYLSPEERTWYLANCLNVASTGGGAASGGGGGGGGSVSGVEYAIGARLVIPSIGLNTTVTGMDVGPSGAMPDPHGYFNAVLYKFPYHGGAGGNNKVLAGHVDCARCHNGSSGQAVFYSVRSLAIGATAQYFNPDGSVTNYTVVASYTVSPNSDWGGIVASGAADMTLITCTGTFSGGHYDNRHVVQLKIS